MYNFMNSISSSTIFNLWYYRQSGFSISTNLLHIALVELILLRFHPTPSFLYIKKEYVRIYLTKFLFMPSKLIKIASISWKHGFWYEYYSNIPFSPQLQPPLMESILQEAMVLASSSFHLYTHQIKKTPKGVFLIWRAIRDSNPKPAHS